MDRTSTILDWSGKPLSIPNGKPRPELFQAMVRSKGAPRRAAMAYDGASSSDEYSNYWANADALDPNSALSKAIRLKLISRLRYECESNGYIAGIINTHCNMLMGVGPTLRMLSGNRQLNQTVEKAWHDWTQATGFRRKLWCITHARTGDGESIGVKVFNEAIDHPVQLDLVLVEAEQCQTPYLPNVEGYTDGVKKDALGNAIWYDILPHHPGASFQFGNDQPLHVPADDIVHWFKLVRPGQDRGVAELACTLNLGAASRRWREATLAAAETAADLAALLTTLMPGATTDPDPIASMSTMEIQKRMMTALPMGWDAKQMKGEHPNATFSDFQRQQISESARPLSMPYNAAACDSSTYSFASGKLDTLCYRAALDVERADCNELVLDRIFRTWWRLFTAVEGGDRRFSDRSMPDHQWDWPAHPVIDEVADAEARDKRLKNGTLTMRQAYSDQGMDYEDALAVMAEDAFGEATDENVEKIRQIQILRNTTKDAMPFVAQLLGIELPKPEPPAFAPKQEAPAPPGENQDVEEPQPA